MYRITSIYRYDRPDMIEYLKKRGIDITSFCDPMDYGNPLFYAIYYRKVNMIYILDLLGCSVRIPCDSIGTMAIDLAKRKDDQYCIEMITYCLGKEQRATTLVYKHFHRIKTRKHYLRKLAAIPGKFISSFDVCICTCTL